MMEDYLIFNMKENNFLHYNHDSGEFVWGIDTKNYFYYDEVIISFEDIICLRRGVISVSKFLKDVDIFCDNGCNGWNEILIVPEVLVYDYEYNDRINFVKAFKL